METVRVTITGQTDILMHADNIEWADQMDEWKNKPENKKSSKAGDDRTPAWRWIGCLYYDDPKTGVISMPSENIMRSIMEGAANVPTGKGQKTFKAQSQSGLLIRDFTWPLLVNGKSIPMTEINSLLKVDRFRDHVERVEKLGFQLFVKRARISAAKHVRVRPRFSKWSINGEVIITDKAITPQILQTILDEAGNYKGLGDWRPGSRTPGSWGLFKATVE